MNSKHCQCYYNYVESYSFRRIELINKIFLFFKTIKFNTQSYNFDSFIFFSLFINYFDSYSTNFSN